MQLKEPFQENQLFTITDETVEHIIHHTRRLHIFNDILLEKCPALFKDKPVKKNKSRLISKSKKKAGK